MHSFEVNILAAEHVLEITGISLAYWMLIITRSAGFAPLLQTVVGMMLLFLRDHLVLSLFHICLKTCR